MSVCSIVIILAFSTAWIIKIILIGNLIYAHTKYENERLRNDVELIKAVMQLKKW